MRKETKIAEELLKYNPKFRGSEVKAAIHAEEFQLLEIILNRGVPLEGSESLMAIHCRNIEAIKLLLRKGASIDVQSPDREIVLEAAIMTRDPSIISTALSTYPGYTSRALFSAAHYAISTGELSIVEELIARRGQRYMDRSELVAVALAAINQDRRLLDLLFAPDFLCSSWRTSYGIQSHDTYAESPAEQDEYGVYLVSSYTWDFSQL